MQQLLNLELKPKLKPELKPMHKEARLRKQEVNSRPNNRLIQILLQGRAQGQVTETAFGPRVMYAANLLCFLAGVDMLGTISLASRPLFTTWMRTDVMDCAGSCVEM